MNHYPGIGRVTSALCAEWAHHPAIRRLDIIINSRTTNGLFALPDNPQVHYHLIDAPAFGAQEWLSMRQIMAQIRPDWVYAPYFGMPPRIHPTKRLLTLHDAIPFEVGSMSWLRQQILRQIVRIRLAQADTVTTVSAHAAHQIRHHYGYTGALTVIPNGVSDCFRHAPQTNTMHTYGISQPYVLCVSSNQPHKNLHQLLAAWHEAYRTNRIPRQSQLVIAGHADPRRDMPWQHAPYTSLPIVHIADPRDELLNELYHGAHLFVLPSLAEGFGIPIIEALAAGCVVLCHDYATLRQLHGSAVHYADMRHQDTLATQLSLLWHNHELRARYQQSATTHADTFSWAHIAHQYVVHMQQHTAPPR